MRRARGHHMEDGCGMWYDDQYIEEEGRAELVVGWRKGTGGGYRGIVWRRWGIAEVRRRKEVDSEQPPRQKPRVTSNP